MHYGVIVMQEIKKLILFIVEGENDKRSLENILNKLLTNNKVQFYIFNGDIIKCKNCIIKLKEKIQNGFLKNNRYFTLKDINQIVHLVDLDAIFIDKVKIIEDKTIKHIRYEDGCSIVKNKNEIISRNTLRIENIKNLITCDNLKINSNIITYNLYYFSCHLEHVLHNLINADDKEKRKLSEEFSSHFFNREHEFLQFIDNKEFATQLTYQESWQEAIKSNNALNRSTNFNLFFKNIKKESK